MKLAMYIIGGVLVGVALADLATGNTAHNPLPEVIADHLDQQEDLFLTAIGAGVLWFAHSQL